jgi:hypothetical protein
MIKFRKKKSHGKFLLIHFHGPGFGNRRISELSVFKNNKNAVIHIILTNRKWGSYMMNRGNDLI